MSSVVQDEELCAIKGDVSSWLSCSSPEGKVWLLAFGQPQPSLQAGSNPAGVPACGNLGSLAWALS